jgi:hypothetical protein
MHLHNTCKTQKETRKKISYPPLKTTVFDISRKLQRRANQRGVLGLRALSGHPNTFNNAT